LEELREEDEQLEQLMATTTKNLKEACSHIPTNNTISIPKHHNMIEMV
jgi:hypothetical protein